MVSLHVTRVYYKCISCSCTFLFGCNFMLNLKQQFELMSITITNVGANYSSYSLLSGFRNIFFLLNTISLSSLKGCCKAKRNLYNYTCYYCTPTCVGRHLCFNFSNADSRSAKIYEKQRKMS